MTNSASATPNFFVVFRKKNHKNNRLYSLAAFLGVQGIKEFREINFDNNSRLRLRVDLSLLKRPARFGIFSQFTGHYIYFEEQKSYSSRAEPSHWAHRRKETTIYDKYPGVTSLVACHELLNTNDRMGLRAQVDPSLRTVPWRIRAYSR